MANYIVSDTNLTAVANAIRTKGGTSEQLDFPDDFVSAIGDIQTGGGGTDDLLLLEENQLTSRTTTATKIKNYTYRDATLQTMNMPRATKIGDYAFNGCINLTSVDLPAVLVLGGYAFNGCTRLVSVSINPEYTGGGIAPTSTFRNCSSLELIDLKKLTSLGASVFYGCAKLSTLILRKSDDICTISNINVFSGTPFASGRAGGTLYVPQDLIASYQSASNWKTILGYANNQIKAIEGSIYE